MPLTLENTPLSDELPDFVLSYAPPAPPRGGGGSSRRLGRPAWGIGAIATDPDAWVAGAARRHLARAATITSVMGVAWVGPHVVAGPPPAPEEVASSVDEARADLASSPVAFQRGSEGGRSDGQGMRAAGTDGTSTAPTPGSDAATRADAWQDNVIATYKGVQIHQPSPEVRMVGFHEGGSRADEVRPAAKPDRDLGRHDVTSGSRTDPLKSMVLPGRGRGTGSATAIDIAMPAGAKVHAPISGTVTAANPYTLYGQHPDTIITIEPDGHPGIMMEILHVTGVQVEVGDRVVAGRTVIADSPNRLPFPSQIDRFVTEKGRALPHVHLEMQRL